MDSRNFRGSKYLGAAQVDAMPDDTVMEVSEVVEEVMTDKEGLKQEKLVLRFATPNSRPLVLNAGNISTMEKIADSFDTADWVGKTVTFYTVETSMGAGVRIAPAKAGVSSTESDAPF